MEHLGIIISLPFEARVCLIGMFLSGLCVFFIEHCKDLEETPLLKSFSRISEPSTISF